MIDLEAYDVLPKKVGSKIEQTGSMGEKIENSYPRYGWRELLLFLTVKQKNVKLIKQ